MATYMAPAIFVDGVPAYTETNDLGEEFMVPAELPTRTTEAKPGGRYEYDDARDVFLVTTLVPLEEIPAGWVEE
jgi:hypothetical protein